MALIILGYVFMVLSICILVFMRHRTKISDIMVTGGFFFIVAGVLVYMFLEK